MREILREELLSRGAISFARFMEQALYCPNFGYYEKLDSSPGRCGDFYTSVSVGELFGELLAFQFAEWLKRLPGRKFQILEAGAHDGKLAADILNWFQKERPDLLKSLAYWILEPSSLRQKSQERNLGGFVGQVCWYQSWDTLPAHDFNGIIFSNELLDAMPVQRVGWDAKKRQWFEWGVKWEGEDFAWSRLSQEPPLEPNFKIEGAELSEELLSLLPDGFTTETCPAAVNWWRHAARILKSGKLVTFDYGLSAEQFFLPERKNGTLRSHYHHSQSPNVLANPGEQDITAQVNFSAIRETGESEGLKTEVFTSQARFLTGVLKDALVSQPAFAGWTPARTRQFHTLTHPELLGGPFQVIVQSR